MNPQAELFAAAGIDLLLGDPPFLPHPVRLIGALITALERRLGRWQNKIVAGAWLAGLTIFVSVACAFALSSLHPSFRLYLLYAALAPRCLRDEAWAVKRCLDEGDIPRARQRLGQIVGRDTALLSAQDIIRATVETTAENTADAVIAPLFYIALGLPFGLSVPAVWAFKAASTLDSMVGYKTKPYLHLGRWSAKLDDALNYLPARITGLLLVAAAFICRRRWRLAWHTLRRDSHRSSSPNSGWSEAAMAGALGIQLGGPASYGGRWVKRPTLGQAIELPQPVVISHACQLMWAAYALMLGLILIISGRWI